MGAPAIPRRFELVRQLGEGGMGVVHEAIDLERGTRVALKTIRHTTPAALARFKREFRAVQDLSHPNIVSFGELISHAREWFFTMELVEGDEVLAYVRPSEASWRNVHAAAHATTQAEGDPARATAPQSGPSGVFDEARLRAVLRQLAVAVAALHDHGLVHRDIKPSNVRVDRTGRVVLLDFGLVLDLDDSEVHTLGAIVGTPTYMAPEQATGGVGPEADWYAVGVFLFEALTGVPPFEGTAIEILLAKSRGEPPVPSRLVPEVPPDLDALCTGLLHADPGRRPSEAEVLHALGVDAPAPATGRSHVEAASFVGRAREQEQLRDALEEVRAGAAVTVIVRGESGVGKTCLVRRFLEEAALERPELVVLSGRCLEREAVPFKAVDGVVDAIAALLRKLPREVSASIVPTRPALLAEVFPVLRRVSDFEPSVRDRAPADPGEVRARAFALFRELLARLALRFPVVIAIDDLQWADADSLALLAEALRPPDAPAIFVLGTMRTDPRAGAPTAVPALAGDVRTIDVGRLSADEGRALARKILGGLATDADAVSINDGAEGHPLFIDALARHRVAHAGAIDVGGVRLEDALWERVESLGEGARAVMEILAVAGAPITDEILAGAMPAGLAGDRAKLVSSLRGAQLVSITGGRAADSIEPYHDRVRAAVIERLGGEARSARHRALALAHERVAASDAEALAAHWIGAGDRPRASTYAELAADAAARAFAFERAARWYQNAVDLAPAGKRARAEQLALLTKLAGALTNAGHGARASAAYLEAAELAHAVDALDLRRRAAKELVCGGYVDDGLAALLSVLRAAGVRTPRSRFAIVLSILWTTLVLAIRGHGFRRRDERELDPAALFRFECLLTAGVACGMVDHVRGKDFQARCYLEALRLGEPTRVARALAYHIAGVSSLGRKQIDVARALQARLDAIAKEARDPVVTASSLASAGYLRYFTGDLKGSPAAMLEAEDAFRTRCVGMAFEINSMRFMRMRALVLLGDFAELRRIADESLRQAEQRSDAYTIVNVRTTASGLLGMAADDPIAAQRELDRAASYVPKGGFFLQSFFWMASGVQVSLYEGDPRRAAAALDARAPVVRRSLLLKVGTLRVAWNELQARAWIAMAASGDAKAASLLRRAAAAARAIEGEGIAWSDAVATSLRAAVASVEGDEGRARELFGLAARRFEESGMRLHALAARRRVAELAGDRAGLEKVDAEMRAAGITRPRRMAAYLAGPS